MRLAIVVPRYGGDVIGGAEVQARGFAEQGARLGWSVEVWTTCARSHYTWQNVHSPGSAMIEGVVVRRFPVTYWDPDRRAGLEMRLASVGVLSTSDQYEWLASGPHSAPLYRHVADHAHEFDTLIALPYTTPLVHYAAWIAPGRVVVWPCLHREPYAYMEPVRLLLENAWGVMFLSPEEGVLATRDIGMELQRHAVLGGGVAVETFVGVGQAGAHPYLLYIGRLEEGKNVGRLYEYVQRYARAGGGVRLVVLGDGPLRPPADPALEYRGFVSEREKAEVAAGALALCQPSLNESFSITIMESWLAGRPVLVHEDCAVTQGHVRRSKGGLWFRTYEDFVGSIEWLRANSDLAKQMGQNGQAYVRRNYTWGAVVSRFERIVASWWDSPSGQEGA